MSLLKKIWLILVPLTIIGGLLLIDQFGLTSYSDYIIPIIWGMCIVLNLPLSIATYQDDDNPRLIAYFIWVVVLAPIWMIWQWLLVVINLRNL